MAVRLRVILPHAVLLLFAVIFLFPFVWLVMTSLKTPEEILEFPPSIFPETFQWSNYKEALSAIPFTRYMMNTFLICMVNIIGQLFSAPLVAYSISRIPWRGRNIIFTIVVATMILPAQVQMIPQYIIFTKLGWVNTIMPLTIGAFFGAPFFIFASAVSAWRADRIVRGSKDRRGFGAADLYQDHYADPEAGTGHRCFILFCMVVRGFHGTAHLSERFGQMDHHRRPAKLSAGPRGAVGETDGGIHHHGDSHDPDLFLRTEVFHEVGIGVDRV